MAIRPAMLVLLLGSTGFGQDGVRPNPAAALPDASGLTICPAGGPLGAVDLRVAGSSGAEALPFRTINHLSEGDVLEYDPVLRGKEERRGEVALVLIPEKIEKNESGIDVTDPKPAARHQEWRIDRTISVAALVYGPGGLNRKKVAKFLAQDQAVVAQLAEYADKTAQAEQLVATLSNEESSSASVNAALNGFASQYGFAVQIDRTAPVAAQAQTLFTSMNPQLAAYNPAPTAARAGQTAGLATTAATLFFGSPIGLAAGGTAMLLDLRAIAFPDTQFRASFAQPLPRKDGEGGVNLCGQQGPMPPHTRVAYIWASRIPNTAAPTLKIGEASFVPEGLKTVLPVTASDEAWKYLERVRQWELVDTMQRKIPTGVVKLGNQKALEIDLTKGNIPAGDYTLAGFWDWKGFEAEGTVHVRALEDFSHAHLTPASQDKLISKSGKVAVTLEGSDFEFTTKMELQKLRDEFAIPETVRFVLAKGAREGPQDRMDAQIDTSNLSPGDYELLISQQDGKSHAVNFQVLPDPPRITNLPIVVNHEATVQHFVLKGERLDLVSRLEAPGAIFRFDPAAGTSQTERNLTVELQTPPAPGTVLPITAYLADRGEPLTLAKGLEVAGPLPAIASSKLSLPQDVGIALQPGEFPAGYTLNALLDARNVEGNSVLHLGCAGGGGEPIVLHVGEQNGSSNLQKLSSDQLFLAFDTSPLPAGCSIEGTIDNGRGGKSKPAPLGRVVRLPHIDSFTILDAAQRMYRLAGQNLETIAEAGWDESSGVEIANLPAPVAGQGLKQTLDMTLPDPPAAGTTLYVWLRGDSKGRATKSQAPVALPPQ